MVDPLPVRETPSEFVPVAKRVVSVVVEYVPDPEMKSVNADVPDALNVNAGSEYPESCSSL
jgi:epoxyqueuosine reductase QueG